jgi:putative restriction endonuclease
MKAGQKLWTREELILAINLYCKLPFGKLHSRNLDIIKFAKLIGRTPGAVARKLGNFASFDPSLKNRGIRGLPNTSHLDAEIWNEFYHHWDELPYESEKLLAKFEHTTIEKLNNIPENELPKEGKERERVVKVRVNQYFFRSAILSSYDFTCCITGLSRPELLVASHIMPWAKDEKNRLNPSNGLCLNPLHDKAFEVGLIAITPEYKIMIGSPLKKDSKYDPIKDYFLKYDGKTITMPKRFLPDPEFLEHHHRNRFQE